MSPEAVVDVNPTEFNYSVWTITFRVKQYIGVGTLNVQTGRGEVKAQPGDFILSFGEFKLVVPPEVIEALDDPRAAATKNPKIIPLDEFLDDHVLNSKSGPDKFTLPVEAEPEPPPTTDEPAPAPKAAAPLTGGTPRTKSTA